MFCYNSMFVLSKNNMASTQPTRSVEDLDIDLRFARLNVGKVRLQETVLSPGGGGGQWQAHVSVRGYILSTSDLPRRKPPVMVAFPASLSALSFPCVFFSKLGLQSEKGYSL